MVPKTRDWTQEQCCHGRSTPLSCSTSEEFARQLLEHSKIAYRLARQLTRNSHDAEDIVQEAYLRAFRSINGFRGGDARPWLMRIVRNVFYSSIQRNTKIEAIGDERVLEGGKLAEYGSTERELVRRAMVHNALRTLPAHCREVLILREVEELSYRDISALLGVPAGTVMSRLARARARLRLYSGPDPDTKTGAHLIRPRSTLESDSPHHES